MVANLYGRGDLGARDGAARRDWRVTNGIGGYAAGTLSGELTRPTHGLLFAALDSPGAATLLLAKLAVSVELDGREVALDTNAWASGVVSPAGYRHLEAAGLDGGVPVRRWSVDGARLESRVWMERGENTTFVQLKVVSAPAPVTLRVQALVNHRPACAATRRGAWTARVEPVPAGLRIEAFDGAAPLWLLAPGAAMRPRHDWHRDFALAGGGREDHLLAAEITATLAAGEDLVIVASTRRDAGAGPAGRLAIASALVRRRAHERALLETWRRSHPGVARSAPAWIETLVLAADDALLDLAGVPPRPAPWLAPGASSGSDQARDALASLPGLMLATGRVERARDVLGQFLERLKDGLLPRGPESPEGAPAFASADATLWLVLAVRAYFEHTIDVAFLERAFPALEAAMDSLAHGTHGGIAADPSDGLLRAGAGTEPATWLDEALLAAGLPPRHGKAVETNALWFNAHVVLAGFASRLRAQPARWRARAERIEQGFARFWNAETQCLNDVLDGPFGTDASVRPNQILALSLPETPLAVGQRRAVLACCERRLVTSHGMRSLSSDDRRYRGAEPDDGPAAAALGSAWTWLLPHAALAHAAVRGDRAGAGAPPNGARAAHARLRPGDAARSLGRRRAARPTRVAATRAADRRDAPGLARADGCAPRSAPPRADRTRREAAGTGGGRAGGGVGPAEAPGGQQAEVRPVAVRRLGSGARRGRRSGGTSAPRLARRPRRRAESSGSRTGLPVLRRLSLVRGGRRAAPGVAVRTRLVADRVLRARLQRNLGIRERL